MLSNAEESSSSIPRRHVVCKPSHPTLISETTPTNPPPSCGVISGENMLNVVISEQVNLCHWTRSPDTDSEGDTNKEVGGIGGGGGGGEVAGEGEKEMRPVERGRRETTKSVVKGGEIEIRGRAEQI